MGLVEKGCQNLTATALAKTFNGDRDSITALSNLISDGKLLKGAPEHPGANTNPYPPVMDI
jgi:hypothetical protein